MKKDSQTKKILAILIKEHSITPLEALNRCGCMRLAARIAEIKEMGFDVKTRIVKTGQARYAEYRLEDF